MMILDGDMIRGFDHSALLLRSIQIMMAMDDDEEDGWIWIWTWICRLS